MIFYPHFIADHNEHSADLSMLEECALRRLVDMYYLREAPFVNDLDAIVRIARPDGPKERAAALRMIERYFPVAADGLRHNARCDREIVNVNAKIEANRRNGKLGGRPKKTKGHNPRETHGFPLGSENSPNSKPRNKAVHSHTSPNGELKERGRGASSPPLSLATSTPATDDSGACSAETLDAVRTALGPDLMRALVRVARNDEHLDSMLIAVDTLQHSDALEWSDVGARVQQLLETGRGVSFTTLFGTRSAHAPAPEAFT